jgi:hypothetical protein
MNVDHKWKGNSFLIGSAELTNVIPVESEQIVVKYEHLDSLIVLKQVFDLGDNITNGMMTNVVELARRETRILLINIDPAVIETVCATERATPGRHNPNPSVFGVDHLLEIEDVVILGREVLKRRKGPDSVFDDFSISPCPDVLDRRRILLLFNGSHQVQESFLTLPDAYVVEGASLQDFRRRHGSVDATAYQRSLGMRTDGMSNLQGILELITHHRKTDKIRRECLEVVYDSFPVEWIA